MDNDTKIEEMARKSDVAEEPGAALLDDVIQKGDVETPSTGGMKITSAGYTWVYDTKTGVPSKINNNNLMAVLRKKWSDDSYVFGIKQTVKPKFGEFKCLLHSNDPNRSHYDDIGLAICPKDNLASPYQVRRHMLKKHKTEWDAIEQERIDTEKKEDREFQRMLISKATSEAPLYVSNKDKGKKTK